MSFSRSQNKMSYPKKQFSFLLILPLLSTLIFNLSPICAKSVIEACSTSDSCTSLLSYLVPFDSKLSEISSRFQVNISDLLAANSINQTIPFVGNRILEENSLVRIPISCPCTDGIRRSLSTIYTVRAADTLESISISYGGLVSADQIRTVNGFNNGENKLLSGERIVIPLPCTCFNNSDNGITAVYLTYVVQRGESLGSIGTKYGATVSELVGINGLGQANADPGDILAIPIPACSSENLNWYNESLIVPTGSYSLTANNCIKCTCGPADLNLQCFPSGVVASCSHLQCKDTNLFIGDIYEQKTKIGCKVSTCIYRGHNGGKIFRSLVQSSHVHCSGNKTFVPRMPGSSPSSLINPLTPSLSLSPSPSAASDPTMGSPGPASQFPPKTSSDAGFLAGTSSHFILFLLGFFILCNHL